MKAAVRKENLEKARTRRFNILHRLCKHGRVVNRTVKALVVIPLVAHERISEVSEVCTITHFFGENVCNICFPTGMQDGECAVSNPLPNNVFKLFDVVIAFGCHIVTPFNTCLVIVV
jgi:hypothetical protein